MPRELTTPARRHKVGRLRSISQGESYRVSVNQVCIYPEHAWNVNCRNRRKCTWCPEIAPRRTTIACPFDGSPSLPVESVQYDSRKHETLVQPAGTVSNAYGHTTEGCGSGKSPSNCGFIVVGTNSAGSLLQGRSMTKAATPNPSLSRS